MNAEKAEETFLTDEETMNHILGIHDHVTDYMKINNIQPAIAIGAVMFTTDEYAAYFSRQDEDYFVDKFRALFRDARARAKMGMV